MFRMAFRRLVRQCATAAARLAYTWPRTGRRLTVAVAAACLVDCAATEGKRTMDERQQRRIAVAIAQADEYYDYYIIDNAFSTLHRHKDSGSAEILWRLARATCERAKLTKDNEPLRKELMYEAQSFIEQAAAVEPAEGIAALHKWAAILLSLIGAYEGTKRKIEQSFVIREQLERAIELDPSDPTSRHILGVWHFSCADLPGYQRAVARAVFAAPPVGSYDDALQHFLQAEQLQPNFYSKNLYYLALTYSRLGDKHTAAKYLLRVVERVIVSADDMEAFKDSFAMLKRMKVPIPDRTPSPIKSARRVPPA